MLFNYKRRPTVSVNVGGIAMGGDWPVRVQSMTNTATDDIESSAAQCQRIAYAGCSTCLSRYRVVDMASRMHPLLGVIALISPSKP